MTKLWWTPEAGTNLEGEKEPEPGPSGPGTPGGRHPGTHLPW